MKTHTQGLDDGGSPWNEVTVNNDVIGRLSDSPGCQCAESQSLILDLAEVAERDERERDTFL